jgi:hypothetical protein
VGITVGLLLRALLSLVGFGPSGILVTETLEGYGYAAWRYGVKSTDL